MHWHYSPLVCQPVYLIGCLSLFAFCHLSIDLFRNQLFSENSFRNTSIVTNSLDPDQVRRSVWPNLGPNCLQRLSADGPSRQRVNLNKQLWKFQQRGPSPFVKNFYFFRFFLVLKLFTEGIKLVIWRETNNWMLDRLDSENRNFHNLF